MCIRINKELEKSLVVSCCCYLSHVLVLESWKKAKAVLCFHVLGKSWGKVWSCGVWTLLCHSHLHGCGQVFSSLCDLDSPSNYQALCKAHCDPSAGLTYPQCFSGVGGWLLCPSTLALKDELRGRENNWQVEVSQVPFPVWGDHRLLR